MAKLKKISVTTKSQGLKVTHPDTAGIDVGKTLMQVSVPQDRCAESNRCFGTFTKDLNELVAWLSACGVKRVVMESTGIYWVSLFLKLQESGFEAILVNAKDVKNMSGRKTDVCDADWLRFLGSCNLIKPCFQIAAVSRRLREFHRLRTGKIKDMARELQHMQKAMEKMNLKLDSVISDIAGLSGMAIIKAMIAGERDPEALAELADRRCRNDKETIAASLEGTWDMEHMLSLRMAMETYEHLKSQLAVIEREMETFLDSYELSQSVDVSPNELEGKRAEKPKGRKNRMDLDIEQYAFMMYGVNLKRIPGVGDGTLMCIMAELGPDFVEKFSTPAKFCRWCNLTPEDKITGGKVINSRIPKRPNPVGQALRQAAISLKWGDNPLAQYFKRMQSKGGTAQAVVATAHKIAEIVYLMVSRRVEYDDKKTSLSESELLQNKINRMENRLNKLKESKLQLSKV